VALRPVRPAQGLSTFYVIHENGDAGASGRFHGRPHASARDDCCHLVGALDRPLGGDTLVIDTVGYNDNSGSTAAARRTPPSCTRSSAADADQLRKRSSTSSRWTILGALQHPGAAEVHRAVQPPGSELMEFNLRRDNQSGSRLTSPISIARRATASKCNRRRRK